MSVIIYYKKKTPNEKLTTVSMTKRSKKIFDEIKKKYRLTTDDFFYLSKNLFSDEELINKLKKEANMK